MKVGLCQIDTVAGDLEGNVARALVAVEKASDLGAELAVLPEMTVPGAFPQDILLAPGFVDAAAEATEDLARSTAGGPPVVVGTIVPASPTRSSSGMLHGAALLLEGGSVVGAATKRVLAAADVFHEPRWLVPGKGPRAAEIAGRSIDVLLAADLGELAADETSIAVVLSAIPYERHASAGRLADAPRLGRPLAWVNGCGAHDELLLEGRSFALGPSGELLALLEPFVEEVRVVDLRDGSAAELPSFGDERELHAALVSGIRGFVEKNRLGHAFVGLSGGVDSSLVAVLAADALGPARVTGVTIPSRFTDPRSVESARELAGSLGIGLEAVELEPLHAVAERSLDGLVASGIPAENVQARLRALVLTAFVDARGGLLLNTTNKTEASLGYGTLYGDLAGSLCPIADLTKLEVMQLARWIRESRGLIPSFVLERPPSAELAPGQVDPFDYEVVAPEVEELVRSNASDGRMRRSEHKRRQMGVVLKVSAKSFGSGRLVPITRR